MSNPSSHSLPSFLSRPCLAVLSAFPFPPRHALSPRRSSRACCCSEDKSRTKKRPNRAAQTSSVCCVVNDCPLLLLLLLPVPLFARLACISLLQFNPLGWCLANHAEKNIHCAVAMSLASSSSFTSAPFFLFARFPRHDCSLRPVVSLCPPHHLPSPCALTLCSFLFTLPAEAPAENGDLSTTTQTITLSLFAGHQLTVAPVLHTLSR